MRTTNKHHVLAIISCAGLAIALIVGLRSAQAVEQPHVPESIQQTMLTVIDPAADSLWDSVGTEVTRSGTKVKAPKTALQWQKVAWYAQSIVGGAKRLQTPGLPVGANAHSKLADADTPGTRTAAQIRADIDADPARFIAAAKRLEDAASQALTAARSHDANGILSAGEALDAACESCHAAYWYPRTPPQHLPSPEEFDKKAVRP